MAADESEDQFVPLSNERPYSERIVTIKSIIWGEGGGGGQVYKKNLCSAFFFACPLNASLSSPRPPFIF